jgi:acid phosphatase (class A)
LLILLAVGCAVREHAAEPRLLHATHEEFIALFVPPPPADSAQTRRELEQLLLIQERRTPAQADAARADRKTEIWQFARALGIPPAKMRDLPTLGALADRVEDDFRSYVRAAKNRFKRRRPYVVGSRIDPCLHGVRGNLSYPSGHATYGYTMAYLLADMIPEKSVELWLRAQEFALHRTTCGVHFPSDLEAGRLGGQWLADRFLQSAEYQAAAIAAGRELRLALGLPAGPSEM